MAQIDICPVGINYYATSASNIVKMYKTNGSPDLLSLGQLVSAVMLRAATACEARAIYKINVLNSNTSYQNMLARVGKSICEAPDLEPDKRITYTTSIKAVVDELNYHPKSATFASAPTLRNFLEYECEIPTDSLPSSLSDFQDYIDAYEQLKPVLEEATRQSAMTEAELQSAVSRRDVSFTTAANIVKSITGTAIYTSTVLTR